MTHPEAMAILADAGWTPGHAEAALRTAFNNGWTRRFQFSIEYDDRTGYDLSDDR